MNRPKSPRIYMLSFGSVKSRHRLIIVWFRHRVVPLLCRSFIVRVFRRLVSSSISFFVAKIPLSSSSFIVEFFVAEIPLLSSSLSID
jgi:hypothetical protein